MAYYLVRAQLDRSREQELRERIDSGEIARMRPFGTALDFSLRHARQQADGVAVWEEEDYCRPPLAMERAAVLDTYFSGLEVERVEEGEGWAAIDVLPGLWSSDS